MALTLTVLLENRRAAGAGKTLLAKHGLSLLVQDETTTILFDTGPDGSFMHNAAQMGVDLTHLTAVVLSHGHYDHCGGVPWLADNSRIICHPQIACERYASVTVAGTPRKIKNSRMITTTLDSSWNTPASRWLSAIAFVVRGN